MKVRTAVEDDAEELTVLARRAKASWGYPEEWLRAWEPVLRFTPGYLGLHTVFVVDEGTKAVGVVAIESVPQPELTHLWVHPDHQGRGVGRALMIRATEFARSNGWPSLRIESDPNAQAFYERFGAIQIGEIDAPVAGHKRSLPLLELPVPAAR